MSLDFYLRNRFIPAQDGCVHHLSTHVVLCQIPKSHPQSNFLQCLEGRQKMMDSIPHYFKHLLNKKLNRNLQVLLHHTCLSKHFNGMGSTKKNSSLLAFETVALIFQDHQLEGCFRHSLEAHSAATTN
jgi:hypothetical protein